MSALEKSSQQSPGAAVRRRSLAETSAGGEDEASDAGDGSESGSGSDGAADDAEDDAEDDRNGDNDESDRASVATSTNSIEVMPEFCAEVCVQTLFPLICSDSETLSSSIMTEAITAAAGVGIQSLHDVVKRATVVDRARQRFKSLLGNFNGAAGSRVGEASALRDGFANSSLTFGGTDAAPLLVDTSGADASLQAAQNAAQTSGPNL